MLAKISNSCVTSIHSFDSEIYTYTIFVIAWESIVLLYWSWKYETTDWLTLETQHSFSYAWNEMPADIYRSGTEWERS